MSALDPALADYLAVRRSLGFRLKRAEKLLGQFIAYLTERGTETVSVEHAVAWALAPGGSDAWHSLRLQAVRGFAAYLHGLDPAHEVPAAEILPDPPHRATPFIYSEEQMAALIEAAGDLRPSHRSATHRTLIGLLAATGMRIGEALALDRGDLDLGEAVIVVRNGKFGKSRELPVHESTAAALGGYLARDDRPAPRSDAVFLSITGNRLSYTSAQDGFHQLLAGAGIEPISSSCRPRLHDIRHAFAVRTMLEAYRDGVEVESCMTRLATYLGHVDPAKTYWYLSAAPELMGMAAERLGRFLGEGS